LHELPCTYKFEKIKFDLIKTSGAFSNTNHTKIPKSCPNHKKIITSIKENCPYELNNENLKLNNNTA